MQPVCKDMLYVQKRRLEAPQHFPTLVLVSSLIGFSSLRIADLRSSQSKEFTSIIFLLNVPTKRHAMTPPGHKFCSRFIEVTSVSSKPALLNPHDFLASAVVAEKNLLIISTYQFQVTACYHYSTFSWLRPPLSHQSLHTAICKHTLLDRPLFNCD